MTAAFDRAKFSTQPAKAEFPSFCNWLIAVESPRTSKFPSLSSTAGPDAGINGQWDLSGAASPIDSPFDEKGLEYFLRAGITVARARESLLWFVVLLVRPRCLTHLIVLRFADAFFEKLRTLAPSLGIFVFSEGVCCLPSG